MSGFIEGENRYQSTLFPERVDDYVDEDSVARVVDVFIDRLDISGLGFQSEAADTGRPGFHPRTMLKIYVYGYLNQVHSSRRLEREAKRNVVTTEVKSYWLARTRTSLPMSPSRIPQGSVKKVSSVAASSATSPKTMSTSVLPENVRPIGLLERKRVSKYDVTGHRRV